METRHHVYAHNMTSETLWCDDEKVFPGESTLMLTTTCPDDAEDECERLESRYAPDFRATVY